MDSPRNRRSSSQVTPEKKDSKRLRGPSEENVRIKINSKKSRRKSRSPDESLEKSRRRSRDRSYTRSRRSSRDTRRHHRGKDREPHNKRYESPQNEKPAQAEKSSVEDVWSKYIKSSQPAERPAIENVVKKMVSGIYIPPAKLKMLRDKITDKSSEEYQRMAWEALKKTIHGLINKVNISNIGFVAMSIMKENIIRGKGLLCRSIMQAQIASPTFTNVYASLMSVINSKFPTIGELLITRCVMLFKRSFMRNDKQTCITTTTFIAHLVNQGLVHEVLVLEILIVLVDDPTNDSVEIAISLLKECGETLTEKSSKSVNMIFDSLRNILHENQLDKRVQYMIEVIFQIRKNKFKDYPAMITDLELIEESDRLTHLVSLNDKLDPQNILNVYKYDENYQENEEKFKTLIKEILGSDAEDGSDADAEDDSDDDELDEENDKNKSDVIIQDETGTNMIRFRRTVYLTIQSSLDHQECAHKLLKMDIKPGQEIELCHMILDCCTQERTYLKFFGSLAERFCRLKRDCVDSYCEIFKDSFQTIHRLETNRLRNVAKFYAQLLYSDAIPWNILAVIRLNEEDTTSSSRIFIKILFQELSDSLSLGTLKQRLTDPSLEEACQGLFPKENPKNTRFAINFFTSIGLGGLTDELRTFLKTASSAQKKIKTKVSSSSSSTSSSSSSSSTSSDSEL